MLVDVCRELDEWIRVRNVLDREAGLPGIRPCAIRVVGQAALMEVGVPLVLATTQDVDVKADYPFAVQEEFERLLAARGRFVDPVGHEAWMPKETRYRELFAGEFVRLLVAEPEAVLLSKALKAPAKNAALLTEYLAKGPSERFVALAAKYRLDLEQFS